MTAYDKAIETIRTSGIDSRIIDAKIAGNLTVRIDADLWDSLMHAVRLLCGTAFRMMYRPWTAFMYDGIWIERAK